MALVQLLYVFMAIIFVCFAFVILCGAPFLPTLKPQILAAIDLLDLKPGQTMIELGCGDGRVMLEASKRGIKTIGYELNPVLVLIAKFRLRKYRKISKVVWGNFWKKKWPKSDGIFTFLLVPYMSKLHNKIVHEYSGPVKLVSFAFKIEDKTPAKTVDGLYLYVFDGEAS